MAIIFHNSRLQTIAVACLLLLLAVPSVIRKYQEWANQGLNLASIDVLSSRGWTHVFTTDVTCHFLDDRNIDIVGKSKQIQFGFNMRPQCTGLCSSDDESTVFIDYPHERTFAGGDPLVFNRGVEPGIVRAFVTDISTRSLAYVEASIRCNRWQ